MDDLACKNINKPVIEVNHADLQDFCETSIYRKICPACKEGVLAVHRDNKTFELSEYDYCFLCGQRVRYMDINKMRAREKST